MRFSYRAAGPVAAVAVLALLSACSRTQQDWRAAQEAGTPAAYQAFVERHPDSELAGVARQRIAQLGEEAAWRQAERESTAAGYQRYLAQYPNGSWSQDARIRIQSKSLEAQGPQGSAPNIGGAEAVAAPGGPAAAPAPATPSASPRTASASPGGMISKPVAAARAGKPAMAAAPMRSNGPAVQLGAFGSSANARMQWSQLSSRFRRALRGLTPSVVPVTVSGRRLYRLEARVASQDAARRLCRQLQRQSQGCLPLP